MYNDNIATSLPTVQFSSVQYYIVNAAVIVKLLSTVLQCLAIYLM